jgi:hypothetical protein
VGVGVGAMVGAGVGEMEGHGTGVTVFWGAIGMNEELSFRMTMPPGSCEGRGVGEGIGVGVGVGVAADMSRSIRTPSMFTK